jgi:hypothetical protein
LRDSGAAIVAAYTWKWEETVEISSGTVKTLEIKDGDKKVRIDVYPDDQGRWLLEIVDEHWNSTVWDEPFDTAEEAIKEGITSIEDEGMDTFIGAKGTSESH